MLDPPQATAAAIPPTRCRRAGRPGTDVSLALRTRINLHTAVVGKLQASLSQFLRRISNLTIVDRLDCCKAPLILTPLRH